MSPSTAAQRVLDIYELLEAILQHIPLRDLLLSRRVNKKFKETITNSRTLQQALFLRAASPSTGVPTLNQLLTQYDETYRQIVMYHAGVYYCMTAPPSNHTTNPISVIEKDDNGIWHLDLDIQARNHSGGGTWKEVRVVTDLGWFSLDGGLWQHMYLSQPPCDLHVHVSNDILTHKSGVLRGETRCYCVDTLDTKVGPFGQVLSALDPYRRMA